MAEGGYDFDRVVDNDYDEDKEDDDYEEETNVDDDFEFPPQPIGIENALGTGAAAGSSNSTISCSFSGSGPSGGERHASHHHPPATLRTLCGHNQELINYTPLWSFRSKPSGFAPSHNYEIILTASQFAKRWVGCVTHSLTCLGSIPAAALIRRLSPRTVILVGVLLNCGGFFATAFVPSLGYAFLTYGVVVGLGDSFILQAGYTLSLMWFPTKYCARASSVIIVGTPSGMLISGLVLNTLISAYGWRHAFMMASSVIFVISFFAGLFMTTPPPVPDLKLREGDRGAPETELQPTGLHPDDKLQEIGDIQDGSPSPTPALVPFYRQLAPWLMVMGVAVGAMAWTFHAINLYITYSMVFLFSKSSFMDSIGLTEGNISLAVVVLSLGQITGKILVGIIGDSLPFLKLYVMGGSFIGGAVLSGFLSLTSTLPPMLALTFFFGMCRAGFYATFISASMEIFNHFGISVVILLVQIPYGIGVLISAPLAGGLYDLTGDYTLSLVAIAGLFVFAAASLLLIAIQRRLRRRTHEKDINVVMHDTKYAPIHNTDNNKDTQV
ncbi:monocarboxylate transporter 13-like [Patiria miniata]|uniref:Major facilitator superfamily (MFS) profile domain-containing protein n=1 Tax=Patiria miniata TaxID=46514 RepID=A0A913ZYE2_PATMI|nr:monocarboxylate transporter 13-like [Patiria miniata]